MCHWSGSRSMLSGMVTAMKRRFQATSLTLKYEYLVGTVAEGCGEAPHIKVGRHPGSRQDQVILRLYVGRFAAPMKGTHEEAIREWATLSNAASAVGGAGRHP